VQRSRPGRRGGHGWDVARRGRPWFTGQVARYLDNGAREPAPDLERAASPMIDELYDECYASRATYRGAVMSASIGLGASTAAETGSVDETLKGAGCV